MALKNTNTAFGWFARLLHWTSVLLVLALFVGISGLDVPPKLYARADYVDTHVALGWTLLVVMILRLSWRLTNANPLLGWRMRRAQRAVALTLHRGMYVVVGSACITGVVAGGDALPDWVQVHAQACWILLAVIVVHAGIATANLLFADVPQDANQERGGDGG